MEIIQRFRNKYLRIIINAPWYVNDTLRHDLNVPPYVRDEIKKLSQRLEEHPNARDVETSRGLKRKLPRDLCIQTVIYRVYATGHMLFKTFTNC